MSNFSPESVMKDLVQLVPIIYTALYGGTSKAKEYFAIEDDNKIDIYLAPNIVRYHAVRYLRLAGQDAQEDDENEISMATIPNNGIHVNYSKYKIKILKSNKGELPIPGHSESRRNFYDQPFLDYADNTDFLSVNLILLWNVDKSYTLGTLSLACPKSGEFTRESVTHHWHCKIPQRMLYGAFKDTDVITSDEILDLDLEKDIDQTGTEGIK